MGAAMAVPVFGRGFAGGETKNTLEVFVMLVAGAGFEPTRPSGYEPDGYQAAPPRVTVLLHFVRI